MELMENYKIENDGIWISKEEINRLTKEPRYTKVEIENMLYRIIDDHNLWADDEDKGAAFKLLNAFLKEWK